MSVTIHEVTSDDEISSCFVCYKELRPHLDHDQFVSQVKSQQRQGFRIAYIQEEREVKAAIGYRFLQFLAWGKVLYIDDLITGKDSRGKGFGGALLDFAVQQAKLNHCDQIHLDTGYTRHEAHQLYLKKGFRLKSHHLSLELF